MEKGKKLFAQNDQAVADAALQALEKEWGEPILYRATGRFLAAQGLEDCPLDAWGLIALTPSRLIFRHYAQAHPLFGGKGDEVTWQVSRDRFASCSAELQSLWRKVFSGTPDHISLAGAAVHLALETADLPTRLPEAWASSLP